MSTKPTNYAQWDTNSTNVSATTAGHKTDGWANNEIPTAAEFNYWQKQVSDWTKWLYDGDIGITNLVVSATTVYSAVLNVTLTAAQNNWDPAGTGNLSAARTIRVQGNTQGYNIYGLVAGTDGQEIEIINVGSYELFLAHERTSGGTTTAANRFSFGCFSDTDRFVWLYPNAVVRLRYDGTTQRWRCLSMQGCLIERHVLLGGSSAATNDPANNTVSNGVMYIKSTYPLVYPITLPTGSILESYTVYLNKGSDNTHDIRTRLESAAVNIGTGTTATETYASTSANAPGAVTLAGSPIVNTANYTIGGDSLIQLKDSGTSVQFYIVVGSAAPAGTAVDLVNAVILYAFVPFGC